MNFELTILGSSSALPTSKRYPTAHVLNVHERFFLIDCGEGTQIQIRKYQFHFNRINHIFISHLHGDHYFGLIGLLSTFSLLGRITDLHIFAHSELPEILKAQLNFLNADSKYRIIWHPLNFKTPQLLFEDKTISVTSFPLKHRIPCCGFVFREQPTQPNIIKERIDALNIPLKEIVKIKQGADFITDTGEVIPNSELLLPPKKQRSYCFCTDTIYNDAIVPIIKEVDILYHEATYDKSLEKRALETFHSTAEQAALIAKKANAKKLVIGHYSARYKDIEPLLDEARLIFGETYSAEEGATFSVEQHKSIF